MAREGLMEGLPTNIPDLEEPCTICLLVKANEIPRGPTTDVSKFPPWSMLQKDFSFFNVESICGFTSTFVDTCYAHLYLFGFLSISKRQPLDILKFIVTTLSHQDKKFSSIRVDEDRALVIFSEFMNTCHNMNIIVQTTSGYGSFINGKIKRLIRHLLISQELFYWNQVTRKNFDYLPISMSNGSPAELRIDYVVMFPTYFGTKQYLNTHTSKYGVWRSTSSMDVLQEKCWW